jgi:hypothetical protein
VLHEGLQDRAPRAPAASVRRGRHSAHPPIPGLAIGADQPYRDELVSVERPERDGAGGLVRRELLDRHVRAQDLAA